MKDDRRTAYPASGGKDVDENLLERWSRRKEMARQGKPLPEPDEAPDRPEAGTDEGQAAGAPEIVDRADEAAAEAGPPELPPIESLDENSNYSAFMASDVSPDLRRQALHKLFHSPKFNLRDGLDDYDLDYTNPEPLGNIVTAEMRRRILREIERLAETDEQAAEETVAIAADAETDATETNDPAPPEAGEDSEDSDDDRTEAS